MILRSASLRLLTLFVFLTVVGVLRAADEITEADAWSPQKGSVSGNGTNALPAYGFWVTVRICVNVNGTIYDSQCNDGGGYWQGTTTGVPKGTWPVYGELRLWDSHGNLVGGPYKSNSKNVTVE